MARSYENRITKVGELTFGKFYSLSYAQTVKLQGGGAKVKAQTNVRPRLLY